MKRRKLLKHLAASIPETILMKHLYAVDSILNSKPEIMASGPFEPNWASLSSYQTPEWFKNAKFGVWARWGAQCQPEFGDWYALEEGSRQNKYHVESLT